MTDSDITVKVIEVALVLFAFVGAVVFGIRIGYGAYRHWQARQSFRNAPSTAMKINIAGLSLCLLIAYIFRFTA